MSNAGTAGTSLDPAPGSLWRAARGPVLVAALALLGAVLLAVLGSGEPEGDLDPRSAQRGGAKALAEVLRAQGVRVELAETTDAALGSASAGSTLLVTVPGLLVEEQLRRVAATGADLVLLAPDEQALEIVAPDMSVAGPVDVQDRDPACDLPAAIRAGTIEVGGRGYGARPPEGGEAFLCYAAGNRSPVAQIRTPEHTVTVLGDPALLTNERLDEDGNAALAMSLLGAEPSLVWYLPSLSDVPADAQQESLYSLLPDGVGYGAAMLAIAILLLAAWRMRRLGPVVPEPLPVVVRAAETVEGRARLYRRARATGKAADALRRSALGRLGPAAGLPRAAYQPSVVDALSARTGRSREDVGHLLYGAAPTDDDALVGLANALDALEREVRRS